jgi:hypothetical protein
VQCRQREVFVISQQTNDLRHSALKVYQIFNDGPAVWSTVNIVADEDKLGLISSIELAPPHKTPELIHAAMNVADGVCNK